MATKESGYTYILKREGISAGIWGADIQLGKFNHKSAG